MDTMTGEVEQEGMDIQPEGGEPEGGAPEGQDPFAGKSPQEVYEAALKYHNSFKNQQGALTKAQQEAADLRRQLAGKAEPPPPDAMSVWQLEKETLMEYDDLIATAKDGVVEVNGQQYPIDFVRAKRRECANREFMASQAVMAQANAPQQAAAELQKAHADFAAVAEKHPELAKHIPAAMRAIQSVSFEELILRGAATLKTPAPDGNIPGMNTGRGRNPGGAGKPGSMIQEQLARFKDRNKNKNRGNNDIL